MFSLKVAFLSNYYFCEDSSWRIFFSFDHPLGGASSLLCRRNTKRMADRKRKYRIWIASSVLLSRVLLSAASVSSAQCSSDGVVLQPVCERKSVHRSCAAAAVSCSNHLQGKRIFYKDETRKRPKRVSETTTNTFLS